ncbi:MAG: hydrogenase expression/formation protein HypE [Parvibaculaceae bacterium]
MSTPQSTITLAHGSGGKAMHNLIQNTILAGLGRSRCALQDHAEIDFAQLGDASDRLAFTTDSFVVDPVFFQGGDIGSLSVAGTVNDLAVGGARPYQLSLSFIIEEGFAIADLERIIASIRATADQADVEIVTGDTKVVPRGSADGIFINTSGIGVIPARVQLHTSTLRDGDRILVNGFIGDHGAAIADARESMGLSYDLASDCAPLNDLIDSVLSVGAEIRCMRDATRGGLATVLNEFAADSQTSIALTEDAIPIRQQVRGFCELLGLDPLYLANEGKVVIGVAAGDVGRVLETLKAHPLGEHASCIGEVISGPKSRVTLNTSFGGDRILDVLTGEQLPRIC